MYLAKVSSRCLRKMTFRFPFKTTFALLQEVLARYLAYLNKTSLRHLVDVFLLTWIIVKLDDFRKTLA